MFYNILEQKQCYKLLAQLVPFNLEHNEIITSFWFNINITSYYIIWF